MDFLTCRGRAKSTRSEQCTLQDSPRCVLGETFQPNGFLEVTITSILVLAGEKCEKVMAKHVRNVPVQDVECDEIWAFVQKKEGHKSEAEANDEGKGDAYCFVAVERSSKLVINFALGRRDQATTDAFIEGLRDAVAPGRFQITTDGFVPYISAITTTLGHCVDFARVD